MTRPTRSQARTPLEHAHKQERPYTVRLDKHKSSIGPSPRKTTRELKAAGRRAAGRGAADEHRRAADPDLVRAQHHRRHRRRHLVREVLRRRRAVAAALCAARRSGDYCRFAGLRMPITPEAAP